MALFKILKGNKSTLPTTKNEGYMYITKDTGDIYVDMSASERLQLNANKAYKLRDNNDNLISVGDSSKPVYFSEGIPVETTGKMIMSGTATGAEEFNHSANTASGEYSHAEGYMTTASQAYAHAEGTNTHATGQISHAEGSNTWATGQYAHAEGNTTRADGIASHSEGSNTAAKSDYQHVQGKFNVNDSESRYAHIVGNGENANNKSNAHTLDWDGNAWFAGDVYVGGTSQDEGSKLATMTDLENNSNYTYGTEDLEAGVSSLENGKLYFVYE